MTSSGFGAPKKEGVIFSLILASLRGNFSPCLPHGIREMKPLKDGSLLSSRGIHISMSEPYDTEERSETGDAVSAQMADFVMS